MKKLKKIQSVNELLAKNLEIPDYQRPYKWDSHNIIDLMNDIDNAIDDRNHYGDSFKYRIGTIILHRNKEKGCYDIVDGQQRLLSLVLLKVCLEPGFHCSLLDKGFTSKTAQANLHRNYNIIRERLYLRSDSDRQKYIKALKETLEVVVICVDKVSEAFQLFDSQNTRGKELDPHDLLKAYHLREMKNYPYEMEHAVTKWEAKDTSDIKDLFDLYLFPIWNWSRGLKCKTFTAKEIDTYKGIQETSSYTYARRASKAMPYFQITEPFIAGNDFFEMVDHYLLLLGDVRSEMRNNEKFKEIKDLLNDNKESAGYGYAKNLFYCALLCYYDRFHNFDEMAVKKLFIWSFMLRVDLENLGYSSINLYATGDTNHRYTNNIPMFSKISLARTHHEISSIQISTRRDTNAPASGNWKYLYSKLKEMNGTAEVKDV